MRSGSHVRKIREPVFLNFSMDSNGLDNPAKRSRSLVAHFKQSSLYRDYEQAFREATGLTLELRPVEAPDLPRGDDPNRNPFCALMLGAARSCAACAQLRGELERQARDAQETVTCYAGLSDSAVPVRMGESIVAFLETGQVFFEKPARAQFSKLARQLLKWGAEVDGKTLEDAWFKGRVITRKQYDAALRLLSVFARHLASLGNQLMVQEEHHESPVIARARAFINEHHDDDLTLAQVAHSVNTSAFYFCKMFRKFMGMTFTDYLARVRVERVKNLLLNPHKRVSEAAFEAGFQSLSQFNRVFRKLEGCSPSAHRAQLHAVISAK